jgi:hypothetical protein
VLSTICALIPFDRDMPVRARRLEIFRRVLDGTLYDALPYAFHEERNASGDYIPLRQRQPSVRYALARVVVEDSAALLFSEGHFPTIDSPDRAVRDAVAALARATKLNSIMMSAALRGSIGSVAILLRVLRHRIFLDVLDTPNLTPIWWPDAPDTLQTVTERYKVAGSDLIARGYTVADPDIDYWFVRQWDRTWERWYEPAPVGSSAPAALDESRSVRHGLGFVPLAWIRNLPGGDGVDGRCTFAAAIDTNIEIDYQLSQAGRGLKYSSDPTLLLREPAGIDGTMVRGAANALVVSEKGDAKLLEIGGTASQAVIDYVRTLRELALENVHGNRAEAHRLSAPASGRALELMNQGLVWLADNLRVSYGEAGILTVARMMLRASRIYELQVDGHTLQAVDQEAPLTLRWPDWYPSDAADRQRDAQSIIALVQEGLMSRENGRHMVAVDYNIEATPPSNNSLAEGTA